MRVSEDGLLPAFVAVLQLRLPWPPLLAAAPLAEPRQRPHAPRVARDVHLRHHAHAAQAGELDKGADLLLRVALVAWKRGGGDSTPLPPRTNNALQWECARTYCGVPDPSSATVRRDVCFLVL